MGNTLFGISVDCTDAAAVARFWGAVLSRQVAEGATSEDAVLLVGDDAMSGPRMSFHSVPKAKLVKNRGDIASWTTFLDIEGNEFDLIAG